MIIIMMIMLLMMMIVIIISVNVQNVMLYNRIYSSSGWIKVSMHCPSMTFMYSMRVMIQHLMNLKPTMKLFRFVLLCAIHISFYCNILSQSLSLGKFLGFVGNVIISLLNVPLSSNRQHLSSDVCLQDKMEHNQNCFVLCCVRPLCTMICTHM